MIISVMDLLMVLFSYFVLSYTTQKLHFHLKKMGSSIISPIVATIWNLLVFCWLGLTILVLSNLFAPFNVWPTFILFGIVLHVSLYISSYLRGYQDAQDKYFWWLENVLKDENPWEYYRRKGHSGHLVQGPKYMADEALDRASKNLSSNDHPDQLPSLWDQIENYEANKHL